MKTKSILWTIIAATMLAGSPAPLSAAQAPKDDAAISAKLVTAIKDADYDAFVADGEAPFKELRKTQFEAVVAQFAPKLQVGYRMAYLGELRQRGYRVTLWKLSFKDGGDDALVTLSMKDGKVGGFWIR